MKNIVLENFLRYVKIDTQSNDDSMTFPSTEKQHDLAKVLYNELLNMKAEDVYYDEKYCYVYGTIPATDDGLNDKVLGFIAHMDTSPEVSDTNVNPKITENYNGGDIQLNGDIVLSIEQFPEMKMYKGKTIVTSDGTTLLGADDKAGVAEIMTMAQYLMEHQEIKHGKIVVAFTPDEEVGAGVDHFDIKRFGADWAYTVDGGVLGEIEYENFNAASAEITINGVSVHPGTAKDKMKNASVIACELESLLPADEKPEHTEGYEGFYHLCGIEGSTEKASISYIIRDHDREKFENRKTVMAEAVSKINEKYGCGTAVAEIKDSYYNMKEKICPDFMFLIDNAENAMKELGIQPKIQPIRGGTDGARLSFMGLPCPNLCTGGGNFHGRFEYACVEDMEKVVELLVKLATM